MSSILGREWAWKKGHVTGEGIVVPGPSLISAPPQQGNDCGIAVNELGRRLMFDESVSSFELVSEGNRLRARQASEILVFILNEGIN